MRINTAKRLMLQGKPALGVNVGLGSPLAAKILSGVGFDIVQVDNQHGCWDLNTTMLAFRDICLGSAVPMARVQENNFYAIGGLLDRGALGIIVPMVETVEQAEAAVRATRYPPRGARSWGPFAVGFYDSDYEDQADEEIFLAVQIESQQAVEHVEDIMAVNGVDACWIGPEDLRKSMGVDIGTKQGAEMHEAAIQRVLTACRKTNKIPGIYAGDVDNARRRLEEGFLFLTVASDGYLLGNRAQEALRKLR